MLSGDAPTIGAANKRSVRPKANYQTLGESQKLFIANNLQTHIPWKPTRVGVRADDVGAKRPEEAWIPRDGGLTGGVQRHAYPKVAVYEGESKATRTNKPPSNRYDRIVLDTAFF